MRVSRSAVALLVVAFGVLPMASANALDQPVSGQSLSLKRSGSGREKLQFASKDPAVLFPPIGGADDPTTNGATIELFSPDFPTTVTFNVPAGAGVPGWTAKMATYSSYKYVDKLAGGVTPISLVQLKQGKMLKLAGKSTGFPLNGATGPIGIRITIGSLRTCALFTADTIKKDGIAIFRADKAPAPADCDDATLGAYDPGACETGSIGAGCGGTCPPGGVCTTQDLSSCTCVFDTDPCGETAPVCNGECPVGEECRATGGFVLNECRCLPTGSTPCNHGNGPSGTCGGDCPAGEECNHIVYPSWDVCGCGPPGPCGSGGGDDCPPGTTCNVAPNLAFCIP